jgi:hypothetical protein
MTLFAAALCVLVIIPLRLSSRLFVLVVSSGRRALLWLRCELYYWWGTIGQ